MKINRLAPVLMGLLVVFVVTSWSGVFLAYAENPAPVSVLVEFNASDMASMRTGIARVEAHGGFCTHRFPFRGCVGRLPAGEDKFLLAEPEIAGVYRGTVGREELALLDQNLEMALVVWKETFVDPTPAVSLLETDPPPPFHDALVPPGRPDGEELSGVSGAGLSSTSPGYYETSEFMIGSVAVGIIMPESDGSIDDDLENWSTARQDEVITEISAALDWWAAREPAAGLSFTYQVERGVPTGYEPITRPQSDEGLWISDVMGRLGYGSGDRWTRVRDYVNALRTEYETDWAFVAFVVDDEVDTDNFFAPNPSGNKYFAYAYLGGPFMVMTYGNDGYGPTNMDAVMSHEMGHIFLALDAYAGSTDCDVHGGYLDVENSNSLNPEPRACGMDEACIMRGQVAPYTQEAVSPSARGQIGWRDSDDDGILDPVDTDVGLSVLFSGSRSSPEGASWAFSGVAIDYPWDSTYRPADVTINSVASVEYQVDGGLWQPASADDGVWDEALEPFTFETGVLSTDVHTVTVQAYNSVGNTSSYVVEMRQTYLPFVMK